MFNRFVGIAVTLALASVNAMPWAGPEPTRVAIDLAVEGRSPKPTGLSALLDPAQIFRRDDETRTCGYVDADFGNAATCSPAYYCAYNQVNGVFGCCSGALNSCQIETACYASTDLALSCGASCQGNSYNRICNEGSMTECRYYVYELGTTSLVNFGCGPRPYTSFVYSTYTNTPAATNSVNIITWVTQSPVDSATSSSTSSPAPATPTPATSSRKPSSKKPIGAIVGGVVGGLAIIVAVVVAILFLFRRKGKNPHTPPVVPGNQPSYPPQQPVYVQQPMKTESVYVSTDPKPPMGYMQPMNPHYSMSPPMSPVPPYHLDGAAVQPVPTQHPGGPGAQKNVYEAP